MPENKTFVTKHLGISWCSEPIGTDKSKKVYDQVQVGKTNVWKAGDFIYHDGAVAQIVYLFEKNGGKPKAHIKLFEYGKNTVLEETCDRHELFELQNCSNIDILSIEVKLAAVRN